MSDIKWGESIREHQTKNSRTVEIVDDFGQKTGIHTAELPNILLNEQILVDMHKKLLTYQQLANPLNREIAILQVNIHKMEELKRQG